MMINSGSTSSGLGAIADVLPMQKESSQDCGGYASGGWKREDGRMSCGYSNFLDAESNTYRDDGSTAATAVMVGNYLYVTNVGDSRAVISKAGQAIPLSEDHNPNRSNERKRIESAGGVVMWAGTWRVDGVLAMSRAFVNALFCLYGYGRVKPDIVAYGREIMASKISTGCKSLSATSMASPVAAGVVCLLVSVIPKNNLESYEILKRYRPRAGIFPSVLDYTDHPYSWPFSHQPLYADAMSVMFNDTILNGMGLIGYVEGQPTWYPNNDEGNLLSIHFSYSKII
ncbi:hypothetical protein GIB67_012687 [Kingdonia uniflora]|uniref:PPM-type phosphatase domain-containing protein n=1 Tax=Kingdonia uniflora TaxID=39325 RepID=A0A7J7NFL3_9MAGN|nr:hypothetical protein GIB67_012687 [Kingdonia uniflora]